MLVDGMHVDDVDCAWTEFTEHSGTEILLIRQIQKVGGNTSVKSGLLK